MAFPLLRLVNPAGLRTSQSKVSIEDVDLRKPEARRVVAWFQARAKVEDQKDRAPTRNPALRQRPVQLPRREAENKKGRAPMVNPGVLPWAELPLGLSKVRENQRVERKRARKFLLRLALNNTPSKILKTAAPE